MTAGVVFTCRPVPRVVPRPRLPTLRTWRGVLEGSRLTVNHGCKTRALTKAGDVHADTVESQRRLWVEIGEYLQLEPLAADSAWDCAAIAVVEAVRPCGNVFRVRRVCGAGMGGDVLVRLAGRLA